MRTRRIQLVRAGTDVVVDFSFWSRAMRGEYRGLLRTLGVVPETVYLATGRATVLERIAARAARDGDDFAISAELAAFYFDHFEPPTVEEGPLTIIGQTHGASEVWCVYHGGIKMEFEFDPPKSASNREKHGVDFVQAQELWQDPLRIEVPARTTGEPGWLVVGQLGGKHWAAVVTHRQDRIRIISVRRARDEEVRLYEV